MVGIVTAIAFALAASLAWGYSDFLAGLQSRREQVLGLLLFSQTAGFAVTLPLAIASGDPLPGGGAVACAAAAGVSGLVGFACFYRAMAIGDIALVAPISGTAAIVPLAVDVVAGHRPGPIAGIGLVLALVGVGVASWERGGDRAASRAAEGAGLAIVAALGFGLFFVGMDSAGDCGVWWPVVIARSASLSTLCLVALATRRSANVAPAALPATTAVGILEIGADILFVAALGHGLAGFVSVFGSLYPLTTVLLAWLVLRERAGAWQGLGAAGALTGVLLLSLGG